MWFKENILFWMMKHLYGIQILLRTANVYKLYLFIIISHQNYIFTYFLLVKLDQGKN